MVAIQEYRLVLPFTLQEFEIAQLYMVAKFSASESSEDSGDGVEVLKNEPFEDRDRKGQYTHKVYHLASKLPSWLVSLLPKKALILEEEAWNAYPHCTTILTCPFLNKFRLVLETTHIADKGTTENALKLEPKTLKKRQVEYIDIAVDEVENYVADEDPTLFRSVKTGRGPLKQGWQENCQPIMCAYKLVTVDVPYWGFGGRIEKFITKTAQRKILLEGHRKCFCWLDEWFGLTMEDIRRMEYETAEAMSRVRALALKRSQLEDGFAESDSFSNTVKSVEVDEHGCDESIKALNTRLRDSMNKRSLRRKPSLVGPSFSVGIATLSASDVEVQDTTQSVSKGPPMPSGNEWKSGELSKSKSVENSSRSSPHVKKVSILTRSASSDSFENHLPNVNVWDTEDDIMTNADDQSTQEVVKCVEVLDRMIVWAKTLKVKKGSRQSAWNVGAVAPVDENSKLRKQFKDVEAKQVEDFVGVLDTALSVIKKRPLKGNYSS